MKKPKILIVPPRRGEHHDQLIGSLRSFFTLCYVADHDQILTAIHKHHPTLLIIGPFDNEICDELSVVKEIRHYHTNIPIILMTTRSTENCVLCALKLGVNDFFKPPFVTQSIVESVNRLMMQNSNNGGTQHSSSVLLDNAQSPLIGKSRQISAIKAYLKKLTATDATVLITGETGTGKGVVANIIHHSSARRQQPFISLNCAAIPDNLVESELFGYERGAFTGASALQKGKFEQASGGTLFLDEISDMNVHAQAKILRVLEDSEVSRLGGKSSIPVDARVIAATNRNPEELIQAKQFRKDLFYRLNVARIDLPPLRERKEDVPLLLAHYTQEANCRFNRHIKGFSSESLDIMLNYDWPGNVRELKNLVEASFINLPPESVEHADLPAPFRKHFTSPGHQTQCERDKVLAALFETNWNKSKAAEKLHWSRMKLYRKMKKYQIRLDPSS